MSKDKSPHQALIDAAKSIAVNSSDAKKSLEMLAPAMIVVANDMRNFSAAMGDLMLYEYGIKAYFMPRYWRMRRIYKLLSGVNGEK